VLVNINNKKVKQTNKNIIKKLNLKKKFKKKKILLLNIHALIKSNVNLIRKNTILKVK
jgi:hypothetical protein